MIDHILFQEMTVCPSKLDPQMYTYTMSIVDLDMESALEGLERTILKLVCQMSLFETSKCIIR